MWKSEFQDTGGAEGLNEFAWGDASGSWWRGDAKQKERNLGRPKLCPATSLHSSNLWLYFKSVPFHVHSSTAERAKATWMQSWGKELHLVDCGAEGKVSLGISTLIAIRPDIFSAHCWRNKKFQLSCIIASISYLFCTLQLIFVLPRRILHLACLLSSLMPQKRQKYFSEKRMRRGQVPQPTCIQAGTLSNEKGWGCSIPRFT